MHVYMYLYVGNTQKSGIFDKQVLHNFFMSEGSLSQDDFELEDQDKYFHRQQTGVVDIQGRRGVDGDHGLYR